MSLIHRSTFKISNRIAVLAALILVFSTFAGAGDKAAEQETVQSVGVQQTVVEQNSQSEASPRRKLSISLLIFGRG
ncbi:MAG: hypothetical protein HKO64_07090 [Xanthomonadales bacterium]|nr:hypothetical protein [Xanthomonadales bacterium]NNL95374.1 hypothetical protein [Xanthomonadales bacterium]